MAGELQAARCGDRGVHVVPGNARAGAGAAAGRVQGHGRDGRAQLPRLVLRVAPVRRGSARTTTSTRGGSRCRSCSRASSRRAPGSIPSCSRFRSRPSAAGWTANADLGGLSVRDREPVPRAGARARRAGRAADVVCRALQQRSVRQLFGADHRGHEVPVDHAGERQQGHADLRPVSRAARDQPRTRTIGRRPTATFHQTFCGQPEHVRGALQRRAAARLVSRAGARLQDDARCGAARQQHPDVGRREPDSR